MITEKPSNSKKFKNEKQAGRQANPKYSLKTSNPRT